MVKCFQYGDFLSSCSWWCQSSVCQSFVVAATAISSKQKTHKKRVDHIYSCPPLVLLVKKQISGLLNVWVNNEIFMAMRLPHFWPCGSSVSLMCLTVMQKTYIMLAQIMTGIEARGWMALKRFTCGPKSVRSLERHFSESVLFFTVEGQVICQFTFFVLIAESQVTH